MRVFSATSSRSFPWLCRCLFRKLPMVSSGRDKAAGWPVASSADGESLVIRDIPYPEVIGLQGQTILVPIRKGPFRPIARFRTDTRLQYFLDIRLITKLFYPLMKLTVHGLLIQPLSDLFFHALICCLKTDLSPVGKKLEKLVPGRHLLNSADLPRLQAGQACFHMSRHFRFFEDPDVSSILGRRQIGRLLRQAAKILA